ncbi:MAG: RNA polymerase factor sigma-54 [Rickettsiales bacterium]|nr:RNA polymerase factor sigma-54 [Pseudomonadota bacterium]MDA0965437.1 RNA polymerase factor sigma-54 [Pseudomonadota bacterium]MDG4542762.1 RNA polymerase factor sigma-54 [Rickettsiales bacterium]MDG4544790.1 RNA polymerase factor sigma-54 [Rickettsiales bacterium]MDG4546912.1 RNA polymerase factor sigma-54 [Rickettsiales bacterium]
MADLSLHIKQSQSMVMTPQLQQAIKILQLSNIELQEYVEQQIEENPFLDNCVSEVENTDSKKDEQSEPDMVPDSEKDYSWDDDQVSPAIYDSDSPTYTGVGKSGGSDFSENEYGIEQIASPKITLKDHIIDQINIDIIDPVQKMIALHLTDMLDDNGYISGDLNSLCQLLKCDFKEIESTLEVLQGFEPTGVFARNLQECLALQLKEKDRFDPAMQRFVENIDMFAKRDIKGLKRVCKVDEEDLLQMCEEIKALNPRPGSSFSSENVQVLYPDVFLKRADKGKWILEINNEILPRVLVNRKYYSEVECKVNDKGSKKFLTEQFTSANWLVKALDQRANTILKVATELVMQQDGFFKKGIHFLKPLVLSDIAQKIEMHESTVSRVINGKYIATHMGIYELKYFFSSSVGSTDGIEDISSKRIKFMIKELIDREKNASVLSDAKIASILKAKGVDVARRTVMKYREAMGIGSSVQRRADKKMS